MEAAFPWIRPRSSRPTTADLTPYDRDSGDSGCPADLRFLLHDGLFTFQTAGPKAIRVHGRHTVSNGLGPSRVERIEIPVSITIQ